MPDQESYAGTNTSPSDPRRLLYNKYLEKCNSHDIEGMKSFYSPDTVLLNNEAWDPEAVAAQFPPLFAAFPDWHWEIKHCTIDGEYLSMHFDIGGTQEGTFEGVEATGKRVKATEFALYRLGEGGKFTQIWALMDINTILKQIQ